MWPCTASCGRIGRSAPEQPEGNPDRTQGKGYRRIERQSSDLGRGADVSSAARARVQSLDLDDADRVDVTGQRRKPGPWCRIPFPLRSTHVPDGHRPTLGENRVRRRHEGVSADPRGQRPLEVDRTAGAGHVGFPGANASTLEDERAQQMLTSVKPHMPVSSLPIQCTGDGIADLESDCAGRGAPTYPVDGGRTRLGHVHDGVCQAPDRRETPVVCRLPPTGWIEERPIEDEAARRERDHSRYEFARVRRVHVREVGQLGHSKPGLEGGWQEDSPSVRSRLARFFAESVFRSAQGF